MPSSLQTVGNKSRTRELIPVRVLVVDEEPLIRWSVCMALAAAGFEAVPARSADDARRLAAEWPPPRMVLLDITPNGPDSDTRKLMAEIVAIYPDCRFLVMSTARSPWTGASGIQTVEKPFDLGELVRLVAQVARPQEASKEI